MKVKLIKDYNDIGLTGIFFPKGTVGEAEQWDIWDKIYQVKIGNEIILVRKENLEFLNV